MSNETKSVLVELAGKLAARRAGGRSPAPKNHSHPRSCDCWGCVKDRRTFYFEMVMIPVLCLAALSVVLFVPVTPLRIGAAIPLWQALSMFIKNMTRGV